MIKVSIEKYNKWLIRYYKELKPIGIRLGQGFFNEFLKHEDEKENLFYVNDETANSIIVRHYLEAKTYETEYEGSF